MKVVFVSNYFNHHQKPFCEEMYRRLGDDFTFISTSVMREERRKLGYMQDDLPVYVYLEYEGIKQHQKVLDLINNADIVMAGAAPNDLLLERIKGGKIILRYVERPFKKRVSVFRRIYHAVRFHAMDNGNKNIYMLCASAYTAADYARMGAYKNRAYKWGYFPQAKEHEIDRLLSLKKKNTLLWCGRFLDWKHPDDVIILANKLKNAGYDFQLNIIGTGVMENELKQLVDSLDLGDRIIFLGSMPPDQVRKHMEEAGIYLFTSDRQEGWGAVLNESMNSGCTVVASHAAGSVPFLIEDNMNGFIYESGNEEMLYERVKYLLEHQEEQERLGRSAYKTVENEWNAVAAATRLIDFMKELLSGKKSVDLYDDGPCSRAEVLKDSWFKESL